MLRIATDSAPVRGDHPNDIAGSTLVSDVDNKVLHDAFKRGRAKNTIMHDTIIDLFWLQVRHDFTLKLG